MGMFRAGIVGCGAIAVSHLKAYKAMGIPVVAVADVVPERAASMAEQCGGAKAFASALELLDSVNLVSVCTPPGAHRELAVAALKRGVHVLCEKPLAGSLDDALAIEEAAGKASSQLMMAFRHRFLPVHRKIKSLLSDGSLGRIVSFENFFGGPAQAMREKWFCNRSIAGGGVLIDTAIHGLDLFRYYCGEVSEVCGVVDRAFAGTDVEDSGILALKAQNGALASIQASWNLGAPVARVALYTDRATIAYDYLAPSQLSITKGTEKQCLEVAVSNGFREQLENFVTAIKAGEPVSPGAADGRRTAEILSEIYDK